MTEYQPFFHVSGRFDAANDLPELVFSDLRENELERRFLRPYQRGRSIVVAGRVLCLSSASSIKIVRTAFPKNVMLEDAELAVWESQEDCHDDGLMGFISYPLREEAIMALGDDVTDIYLVQKSRSSAPPDCLVDRRRTLILAGALLTGLSAAYVIGLRRN